MDLDQADLAIIRVLQEDGRATYSELASASGLNYQSARRRMLKLIDSDVVHINTLVNPMVTSNLVQAGVGIRVNGSVRDYVKFLRDIPQVGMVNATTGPYDLLIEVTCQNKAELAVLTGETLREHGNAVTLHSYLYLSIHKLPHTWLALEGQ